MNSDISSHNNFQNCAQKIPAIFAVWRAVKHYILLLPALGPLPPWIEIVQNQNTTAGKSEVRPPFLGDDAIDWL